MFTKPSFQPLWTSNGNFGVERGNNFYFSLLFSTFTFIRYSAKFQDFWYKNVLWRTNISRDIKFIHELFSFGMFYRDYLWIVLVINNQVLDPEGYQLYPPTRQSRSSLSTIVCLQWMKERTFFSRKSQLSCFSAHLSVFFLRSQQRTASSWKMPLWAIIINKQLFSILYRWPAIRGKQRIFKFLRTVKQCLRTVKNLWSSRRLVWRLSFSRNSLSVQINDNKTEVGVTWGSYNYIPEWKQTLPHIN